MAAGGRRRRPSRFPLPVIAAGSSAHVDVLVGTNTDDWRLFLVISGTIDRITEEILTGPIGVHGYQTVAAYGLPVETGLAAYRAAYPGATPGDLLAAVQTDWWVRIPAIRLAEAHASHPARTYMYEFGWPAPDLGAVHALEIPFVFDTLDTDSPLFRPLLGTDPPAQLARSMHVGLLPPRMAGVRPPPAGHHALRHIVSGDRRSPVMGTGCLGRHPLAALSDGDRRPLRGFGRAQNRAKDLRP